MHFDSDSDADDDGSADVDDDSHRLVHTTNTHVPGNGEKVLDMPSAGDKYGWVEEFDADALFVPREKDGAEEGDGDEEGYEAHVIELDSSDEEAIEELACAASALTI